MGKSSYALNFYPNFYLHFSHNIAENDDKKFSTLKRSFTLF